VEIRKDWYQTQTHVILSLFAKKACKAKTKIVLEETKVWHPSLKLNSLILTACKTDQSGYSFLGWKEGLF
jgi:hypothetical protein